MRNLLALVVIGGCSGTTSLTAVERSGQVAVEGVAFKTSHHRTQPMIDSVLPGEFETVDRLVIGWSADNWQYLPYFATVLRQVPPEVIVTLVVAEGQDSRALIRALRRRGVTFRNLEVVTAAVDTMWVRDYGPLVVDTEHGRDVVDLPYGNDRPGDDRVPGVLANHWRFGLRQPPLDMEGGHIQADGQGTCVITDDVVVRNAEKLSLGEVRRVLREQFGCRTAVVVPALEGEPTGHLDMFVYVTGPRQALVGAYEPAQDAVNAELLDRAADRLTAAGFTVERVPMPDNDGATVFRTHTNALTLNHVVLVPVYRADRSSRSRALAAFRKAFPDRRVVAVAADALIDLAGSVHCTALTIPMGHGAGAGAAFAHRSRLRQPAHPGPLLRRDVPTCAPFRGPCNDRLVDTSLELLRFP